MKNIAAIVLAAGRGTRMKSRVPKVLHPVLGKPMIACVLDSLKKAGVSDVIIVAGYGSDKLKKAISGARIVVQKKLLGSGDAVITAKKALGRYSGDVLVICGDTPLVKSDTISRLIAKHKTSGASATVLTVDMKDPTGYGRIVRSGEGRVMKITEEEEATVFEKAIEEINVGTYCFKAGDLFDALSQVRADNYKKEYFLTDAIEILARQKPVEALKAEDETETIGVNTRKDLAEASCVLKRRIIEDLMAGGVTIEDPASTTIYPSVKIGQDSIIHPNTIIESDVEIGRNSSIGPFARIRGGVYIGDNVEVGNFVELVRTEIGENTKVKHHAYLGDTLVGKNVNIGAGTITANFDGKSKKRTVIEEGAFVGVGAIFIAPVKIGRRAVVGAGCVVPRGHDVPDGATVVGVPAKILRKQRKKR